MSDRQFGGVGGFRGPAGRMGPIPSGPALDPLWSSWVGPAPPCTPGWLLSR